MTETLAMLLPIYYSLTIDTKFFAKLSGNFHFSNKKVFIYFRIVVFFKPILIVFARFGQPIQKAPEARF